MADQVDRMRAKLDALEAIGCGMTQVEAGKVFGVSERTLRRAAQRLDAEGLAGLIDRSRRPHCSPNQTRPEMEEAIVRARKELDDEGWDNGAISIRWRLEDQGLTPPVASTIHQVLRRRGLVIDQPQKRTKSSLRFERELTHELWQIDGMEWVLTGGTKCKIIGILDDHSRGALHHHAASGETAEGAWAAFLAAAIVYGLPTQLLSDNGTALNSDRLGRETNLGRNLRALGVQPISSRPAHPQTCGKRERCNKTLRRWLTRNSTASTLAELQAELAIFDATYNSRRHQSLDGLTPSTRLEQGPFATAPDQPLRRPINIGERRVNNTGSARMGRYFLHVGAYWAGCDIIVILEEPRASAFHGSELIATFDINPDRRFQPGKYKPRPAKARYLGQRLTSTRPK